MINPPNPNFSNPYVSTLSGDPEVLPEQDFFKDMVIDDAALSELNSMLTNLEKNEPETQPIVIDNLSTRLQRQKIQLDQIAAEILEFKNLHLAKTKENEKSIAKALFGIHFNLRSEVEKISPTASQEEKKVLLGILLHSKKIIRSYLLSTQHLPKEYAKNDSQFYRYVLQLYIGSNLSHESQEFINWCVAEYGKDVLKLSCSYTVIAYVHIPNGDNTYTSHMSEEIAVFFKLCKVPDGVFIRNRACNLFFPMLQELYGKDAYVSFECTSTNKEEFVKVDIIGIPLTTLTFLIGEYDNKDVDKNPLDPEVFKKLNVPLKVDLVLKNAQFEPSYNLICVKNFVKNHLVKSKNERKDYFYLKNWANATNFSGHWQTANKFLCKLKLLNDLGPVRCVEIDNKISLLKMFRSNKDFYVPLTEFLKTYYTQPEYNVDSDVEKAANIQLEKKLQNYSPVIHEYLSQKFAGKLSNQEILHLTYLFINRKIVFFRFLIANHSYEFSKKQLDDNRLSIFKILQDITLPQYITLFMNIFSLDLQIEPDLNLLTIVQENLRRSTRLIYYLQSLNSSYWCHFLEEYIAYNNSQTNILELQLLTKEKKCSFKEFALQNPLRASAIQKYYSHYTLLIPEFRHIPFPKEPIQTIEEVFFDHINFSESGNNVGELSKEEKPPALANVKATSTPDVDEGKNSPHTEEPPNLFPELSSFNSEAELSLPPLDKVDVFDILYSSLNEKDKIPIKASWIELSEIFKKLFLENSTIYQSVVRDIVKKNGLWSIDLNSIAEKKLIVESIINFMVKTRYSIPLLNIFIDALDFYDSSVPQKTDEEFKKESTAKFSNQEEKLRYFLTYYLGFNYHKTKLEKHPIQITNEASIEVSKTFTTLKFNEYLHNAKFLDQYLKIDKKSLGTIPFFLMAFNGREVRVLMLTAHFLKVSNILSALKPDTSRLGEKILQEHFGLILPPPSPIEIEGERSIDLNLDQIKKLKEVLKANPKNSPPPYILAMREVPDFSLYERDVTAPTSESKVVEISESESSDVEMLETEPAEATENSTEKTEPKKTEGNSKKRTKPVEKETKAKKPKIISPPNDVTSAHREFDERGGYNPIDPFADRQKGALKPLQPAGIDKPVPPLSSNIARKEEVLECNDLDSFWSTASLNIAAKTVHVIEEVVAKSKVILDGVSNDYPVLRPLKKVVDEPERACINPTLKSYQSRGAKRAYACSKQGLTSVIALEMGLGKSAAAVEYMFQRICDGIQGLNLFLAPPSVIASMVEEVQSRAIDSIVTAWKVTFSATQQMRPEQKEKFMQELTSFIKDCFAVDDNATYKLRLQMGLRVLIEISSDKASSFVTKDMFESDFAEAVLDIVTNHLESILAANKLLPDSLDEIKTSLFSKMKELAALLDGMNVNNIRKKGATLFEKDVNIPGIIKSVIENKLFCNHSTDLKKCLLFYYFVGKILDIDPDCIMPSITGFSWDRLEKMRNFSIRNVIGFEKAEELKEVYKGNIPTSIVITSYEALSKVVGKEVHSADLPVINSFVLDEAHLSSNPKTQRNGFLIKFIQRCKQISAAKELPMPGWLMLTGSPVANNIFEVWNLLALGNLEYFPESSVSVLRTLLKDTESFYLKKNSIKAEEYIKKSFVHFMVFIEQVVNPLVLRLRMSDEEVQEVWKGQLPTRLDSYIPMKKYITEIAQKALIEVHQTFEQKEKGNKKISKAGLWSLAEKAKKIHFSALLKDVYQIDEATPEGEEPKIDVTNKQKINNFVAELSKMDLPQTEEFIQTSPMCLSLFCCDEFKEVIQNNEKAIIILDRIVSGNILDIVIKKKFEGSDCRMYSGEQTLDQRNAVLKWFKDPLNKRPKFVLLMCKAGGVGLNLPEADKIFKEEREWNPVTEKQAESRAFRVRKPGKRTVVHFVYSNIYIFEHFKAIIKEKNDMDLAIWNNAKTLMAKLRLWMDFLESKCYHTKLNHCKVIKDAQDLLQSVQNINRNIFHRLKSDKYIEEALKEGIAMVTPRVLEETIIAAPVVPALAPIPLPPASIVSRPKKTLTLRQVGILPMPTINSLQKAMQVGKYLLSNQKDKEAEEDVEECLSILEKNASFRSLLRKGSLDMSADPLQKRLSEKWSAIIHKAQITVLENEVGTAVYVWSQKDNVFVIDRKDCEQEGQHVLLNRSERVDENKKTFIHYDLLVERKRNVEMRV